MDHLGQWSREVDSVICFEEMEKHIPVHLNAIDCPLKYLDLVPCPKDKNAAQWRARVYSYHNNRVAKRLAKKAVVEL